MKPLAPATFILWALPAGQTDRLHSGGTLAMTRAKLRAIVASAGATLESSNDGRRQEYEAVAPDGSHWEPELTALLATAFRGPAAWSEESRTDLAERVVGYGHVAPCSTECGFCNVASSLEG